MRTCRVVLAALAMLVLAPTTALASVNVGQSGWFWGNPLPQGNTINALDFAGARGYAVGAFGTILRSDDGGGTWSGLAGGTAVDLNLLQAVDANTVIAGGRCTLRRSEDGGKTFTRLPFTSSESSCSSTVSALWFTAPKTGYIVLADGTVLRTDDGGATFSRKTAIPGTQATGGTAAPAGIRFTATDTGVAITHAAGAGRIYRTTDGGVSWTLVKSVDYGLSGVTFVDANDGYAVGDVAARPPKPPASELLTTLDGGATWVETTMVEGSGAVDLSGIRCATFLRCVMTTAKGDQLLRTETAGVTVAAVSPSTDPVRAAAFAGVNRVVAAGVFGTTVISDDAAQTFKPIGSRLTGSLTTLRRGAASAVFALGRDGALDKSTDGGRTWSSGSVSTSDDVIDVAFPTDQIGYALDSSGTLLKTNNGGTSWSILNTGTSRTPRAVVAVDSRVILLIGPRGIRRSTDGGESFSAITGELVNKAILFRASASGKKVVAGGSNILLGSTNSGKTWKKLARPSKTGLADGALIGKTLWVLDVAGRVWKTTDDGKKWTELLGVGGSHGLALSFSTTKTGNVMLAGFGRSPGGYVLHTSDSGKTWRPQLVSPTSLISSIAGPGLNGYALASPLPAPSGAPASSSTTQAPILATGSGGDVGKSSKLTITTKTKSFHKPLAVRFSGKLTDARGGETAVVSFRSKGSSSWRTVSVTVAANGTFTITRQLEATTYVVAQWAGDGVRDGDGSEVLTVVKK